MKTDRIEESIVKWRNVTAYEGGRDGVGGKGHKQSHTRSKRGKADKVKDCSLPAVGNDV